MVFGTSNLMAKYIKTDGILYEIHLVEPANGKHFSLRELQEFVGGYIEIVFNLPDDMIMVVNEEGRLKELPINAAATILAGQTIVGNVLYCKANQVH